MLICVRVLNNKLSINVKLLLLLTGIQYTFSSILSIACFFLHAFPSFTFSFSATSYSSTSFLLFTLLFPFLLFSRRTISSSFSHAPFAPNLNVQQIKQYRLC